MTIGGILLPDDPSYPWTSLPQIPQAPTRISTSPAPAAGMGTSAISSDLYFDSNNAFILPSAAFPNSKSVLTLAQILPSTNVLDPSPVMYTLEVLA
jgi:hypothetical protein